MSRLLALVALASLALVSCAKIGSGGFNGTAADINVAGPTVSVVRTLLGDSNWWQGPPSFDVRPLDAETTARELRFAITQRFIHIGTAEYFLVRYAVYDTTSSATTKMTDLENALGASPSSPKVGDKVLYYGLPGPSGAPYLATTLVRLGQIVIDIDWARKDGVAAVSQLGRNAAKVVEGLKKVIAGKVRPSPQAVDQKLLPPPGLDITFLGAAQLPIEAFLVMASYAIPGALAQELHGSGVDNFLFGDYALNSDTHMEVQTATLTFTTAAEAVVWLHNYSSSPPDQTGVAGAYLDGLGEYHYFFVSGTHGAVLVCKSTAASEAASRACEAPMLRTISSWQQGLAG